jgi:hypothetical protein
MGLIALLTHGLRTPDFGSQLALLIGPWCRHRLLAARRHAVR